MGVQAVSCEPVSSDTSLISREDTGNFYKPDLFVIPAVDK